MAVRMAAVRRGRVRLNRSAIKAALSRLCVTQRAVAVVAGVSEIQLSRALAGVGTLRTSDAAIVAEVLGLPVDAVVEAPSPGGESA